MKKIIPALFASSFLVSASAQAGTAIDLSFSSETVKIGFYESDDYSDKLQNYGFDYLHTESKGGVLSATGEITRAGFESAPNLDVGLKGKAYYVSSEGVTTDSGYGVMIGGLARYWLPTEAPVALGAEYLFGPGVLSFGDADDGKELNLRVEAQILPSATAYVGYRNVEYTIKDVEVKLDDQVHFGIRLMFD